MDRHVVAAVAILQKPSVHALTPTSCDVTWHSTFFFICGENTLGVVAVNLTCAKCSFRIVCTSEV